jgi:hypothetical protein
MGVMWIMLRTRALLFERQSQQVSQSFTAVTNFASRVVLEDRQLSFTEDEAQY